MNKIEEMFDLDKVKVQIKNCPEGEVIILCGHWSINGPKYQDDDQDPEAEYWDFQEFEDKLETTLMVSDYDDLIADPHGIYNS